MDTELPKQEAALQYFYDAHQQAWPIGHRLRNPQLARVYQKIAAEGPAAFYEGDVASAMVSAVQGHQLPGQLSLSDLQAYKAVVRDSLCTDFRAYVMCGMGPPSSGSLAVMQILSLLEHTPIAEYEPTSAAAIHYFAEAGRLAFADRDAYVADPSAMTVSPAWLLDSDYIKQRASLIQPQQSMGKAQPGQPIQVLTRSYVEPALEIPSTTHLVAADEYGGVVSMTTSIESVFGSKIFTEGFLLNNQLTDFSFTSESPEGKPIRNQVAANKRPRSSMAPMMVFQNEKPVIAVGSPGGSAIILYVAKALMGVMEWDLDIQQAINLPNYGSRNQATELEQDQGLERQADALRAIGHEVKFVSFPSGIQGIERNRQGQWVGGADPRREGAVMGY
ncbi:gamma-glutamyltransferase [Paenalcaligenes niemegkensis]|uniref:gamma-glutamyltransferase family protein n=1 Tax=Paenalcaligenes niemegkensis TaxID=2895469 RepID=UPI002151A81D|nr:gamma-glutamyltransferase [Paenalcaligenes niemegkensis]MCQ9617133.1 gamma-glutamyltransferase [Paenalcaligenes niemegkensis]